jgi:hypothetical protein
LLGRLDACQSGDGPLMVVAPSGAGKSSLLRAGLLSQVADGKLTAPGSRLWPRIELTPGAQPMRSAAAALQAALPGTPDERAIPRDHGPGDLDALLGRVLETAAGQARPAPRAVIIVDQFEELFRLCSSEAERAAFISWLWRAGEHDSAGGPQANGLALSDHLMI